MKNEAYELENQIEAVDEGVLSRDEEDGHIKRAEGCEREPVDLSAYLAIEDPEVQVRLVQQLVRVLEFPKADHALTIKLDHSGGADQPTCQILRSWFVLQENGLLRLGASRLGSTRYAN